jgi:4-amino-4-deoxy-L-arabinose transferase-like glycosyltransferase
VAAVLLVFLVADRLWGRRVALVAGALAAVFPPLVLLSASLLSESVFVPLALATLLATLEYRRTRELRWAAVAGVLCGLAGLTRVNGLLLVLAAAAGVWVARPRLRRAALLPPLAVALAAVVTVMPWVVRNTIEFHRFVGVSTQSGYALAATYNAESGRKHPAGKPTQTFVVGDFRDLYRGPLDEGVRSSRLTHRAIDYATGHPGYVAKTLAWNTLRVFDIHHDGSFSPGFQAGYLQAIGDARLASPAVPISVYLVVALALLGAAAQAGLLRVRRAPAFVWLFPLLLVLPAIGVYGLSRYRSPVDPFLVMLAAVALVAVYDRVTARERPLASASPARGSAAPAVSPSSGTPEPR